MISYSHRQSELTKMSGKKNKFESLPDELVRCINSYGDPYSQSSHALTNKNAYRLFSDNIRSLLDALQGQLQRDYGYKPLFPITPQSSKNILSAFLYNILMNYAELPQVAYATAKFIYNHPNVLNVVDLSTKRQIIISIAKNGEEVDARYLASFAGDPQFIQLIDNELFVRTLMNMRL